MSDAPSIRIKRIYAEPGGDDGFRVLVDRLWPRGVAKENARVDLWAKDVAPTTELRKWFGHAPERFGEFSIRYAEELSGNSGQTQPLVQAANVGPVTLLYAARDASCNHAIVLRSFLLEQVQRDGQSLSDAN